MVDQVVTADCPVIPVGAVPSAPVLYPSELEKHKDKVLQTSWEPGAAGQKMLTVYMDDGKSNTSRPVLIQFNAYSQFGLDFFRKKKNDKGFPEDDDEEEQPKKKGKGKGKGKEKKDDTPPRQKPALITFDYNKSPHIQQLDKTINWIVEDIMIDHGFLLKLKSLVAPGNEDKVTAVMRHTARASSGRVKKGFRANAYPGGCEFRDKDGKNVSYNNFTKNYKGDYRVITEFAGISASYKDNVLSYGPVFYVKKLAINEKVQRPALEWRDEEEETVDITKKEEEKEKEDKTLVGKKRKLEEETVK